MDNKLVRYSRAGDAFHYRWAARRCLRLIYPKSLLRQIVIEGSAESSLAGEYVIDVAEYSDSVADNSGEVAYYQLKHTTKRTNRPFVLSELRDTITGFAQRYSEHFKNGGNAANITLTSFLIVTNRPIADSVKVGINRIASGGKANKSFQATIEKYTQLSKKKLIDFCTRIRFFDGEGNYNAQRHELHTEMAQLVAGQIDDPEINNIVTLVSDKALPDSNGKINREDVLQRLGVSSAQDLFPAPAEFEKFENIIWREQHTVLRDAIIDAASGPVIIHSAGGVGKTVLAREIAKTLPEGSIGIVYDCFGSGRYRNRSQPRHRYRDGLVQIANELATKGLCSPLLARQADHDDQILRGFLTRLEAAVSSIRKTNDSAIVVVLLDAADNAEMAALEFSENCFIHELMRETIPDGCRLVALCRTERIDLLQPSVHVAQFELKAFSEQESLFHLRSRFSEATEADGKEFHRLTSNGNPRVQANALSSGSSTLGTVLGSLGPLGTTVEQQIEAQLETAVAILKEKFPTEYQRQIDSICTGLATLPPFVPIRVLATAANIGEPMIRSFISDLGRPLWLTDTSIQFRDEPTETWFRKRFAATQEQIATYITQLEPLAQEFAYVAETLPALLLGAGKYEQLIGLALSDDLLPSDNPIDQRNVRVYRLQFAFKAALKLSRFADAIKLALRAGEEVAGDKRQLRLLRDNFDLVAPLQYQQKVQELAFRRLLRGGWQGSENIYSAALLSSVDDFKGEARGYFRAARNWLRIYFDTRENKKNRHFEDTLSDEDILGLAFAKFNLENLNDFVDFILGWKPSAAVYEIASIFFDRLIDHNNLAPIDEIPRLNLGSDPHRRQYLILAIANALGAIGRYPHPTTTKAYLALLASNRKRIPKLGYKYNDTTHAGIISFFEACAANKNSKVMIAQVLEHYFPFRASPSITGNYPNAHRQTYLRAIALRCVLENKAEPDINELLPKEFTEKPARRGKKGSRINRSYEREIREFKEIIGGLLPWYMVRARLLIRDSTDLLTRSQAANERSNAAKGGRYNENDNLPYEISSAKMKILGICTGEKSTQLEEFYNQYLKDEKQIRMKDRLEGLRSVVRSGDHAGMYRQLEVSTRDAITALRSEGPETLAEWYVDLARAILPASNDDAAAYFNLAIEAVSKFGDEIVERWQAVAALAFRCGEMKPALPEIAYRFMRCAELVGENTDGDHWDRNGATRACVRLSPVAALAILSRWRDRDVGWFERQIVALASEMVSTDFLPASAAWSLSAFSNGDGSDTFAISCIEKEALLTNRHSILNTAIRDLRLWEVSGEVWRTLKDCAKRHTLPNVDLDRITDIYEQDEIAVKQDHKSSTTEKVESTTSEPLFSNLELATSAGINQALLRYEEDRDLLQNRDTFCQELLKRVSEYDAVRFLEALVSAEKADRYDVSCVIANLPTSWLQKISVQAIWPSLFQKIGKRYAIDFTNRWAITSFLERIKVENDALPNLRQGVFEGLSSNIELINADTFFGFAELASVHISPEDALDLLDFALSRFELHIDAEFADGNWNEGLRPPENISLALTGLIWSALGSPSVDARWRAAHSVRRLADLGCGAEIESLLEWMKKDSVDAFGSQKFPFYKLHARQYLLIALARVSRDNAQILRIHHDVFSEIALDDGNPHILIQIFSAQIARNIERSFPGTYSETVLRRLDQIGTSQLPRRELDRYGEHIDSYWHKNGQVDVALKHLHGWDFDRYWFEPLGARFGINDEQVAQLATAVILKDWKISYDGGFHSDPRAGQWASYRNERRTWHSHGSYPQVDNYAFYLSYHSMLVVAAKLIEKMPLVTSKSRYDNEDTWNEWLDRHTLTRKDGYWLADRRDPAPLLSPSWIKTASSKNWRTEVGTDEFMTSIFIEKGGATWLNVWGSQQETHGDRTESVYIASALVSRDTSVSLLNALSSCSDPRDFKLPACGEEDFEFNIKPFELIGWAGRPDIYNGIDDVDPFAAGVSYPPFQVGIHILEKMALSADYEQRHWFLPDAKLASLGCQLWRTQRQKPDEDPNRYGEMFSASFAFLKQLCLTMNCDLILSVQINRRFTYNSSRRQEDDGYGPTHSKVYLLSEDGRFRDTETYYEIG